MGRKYKQAKHNKLIFRIAEKCWGAMVVLAISRQIIAQKDTFAERVLAEKWADSFMYVLNNAGSTNGSTKKAPLVLAAETGRAEAQAMLEKQRG